MPRTTPEPVCVVVRVTGADADRREPVIAVDLDERLARTHIEAATDACRRHALSRPRRARVASRRAWSRPRDRARPGAAAGDGMRSLGPEGQARYGGAAETPKPSASCAGAGAARPESPSVVQERP